VSKSRPVLLGEPHPRIATPPVGRRGRGLAAIKFATDILGIELMPWQRFVLDRACRTAAGERWAVRTVLTIVARQNGKSLVTAVRILAGMWLWDERLIIAAAQNRDVSIESWKLTTEIAVDAGLPVTNVLRTTGREELQITLPDGHVARYKVVSSTPGGGRGLSADLVVLDELREYKDWASYAALDKTRRARPSSQLWTISTEGDHTSVVLDNLQAAGRTSAAARDKGPLGYFEWSAPPEAARDDRRGWAQANPALGHTLEEATIEAELATDPAAVFETEVLCRRVTAVASWLPAGRWDDCTEPTATVPDDATGVCFAADSGPELRQVSIVAAWRRPDGRVHVEALQTFLGPAATIQCEARLTELVAHWRPRLAVIKRGPIEALVTRVAAAAVADVDDILLAVTWTDLERAALAFYEAVVARRLVHPPDPVLADQLAATQPGQPGTMALRRRNPSIDIEAAVAAVTAVWAVDRSPVVRRPGWVAY
jgi:Phage Terminase